EAGGGCPEMPLPPGPNRRQRVSNHSRHRPSLQLLTLCPSDLPSRGAIATRRTKSSICLSPHVGRGRSIRPRCQRSLAAYLEPGGSVALLEKSSLRSWTRRHHPRPRFGHWLAARSFPAVGRSSLFH